MKRRLFVALGIALIAAFVAGPAPQPSSCKLAAKKSTHPLGGCSSSGCLALRLSQTQLDTRAGRRRAQSRPQPRAGSNPDPLWPHASDGRSGG